MALFRCKQSLVVSTIEFYFLVPSFTTFVSTLKLLSSPAWKLPPPAAPTIIVTRHHSAASPYFHRKMGPHIIDPELQHLQARSVLVGIVGHPFLVLDSVLAVLKHSLELKCDSLCIGRREIALWEPRHHWTCQIWEDLLSFHVQRSKFLQLLFLIAKSSKNLSDFHPKIVVLCNRRF